MPEEKVQQLADELQTSLQSVLGKERWPLVQVRLKSGFLSGIMGLVPKWGEKSEFSV